jgi:hypothetical protein
MNLWLLEKMMKDDWSSKLAETKTMEEAFIYSFGALIILFVRYEPR